MVDTQGLVLQTLVHPADVQDREGGLTLLAGLGKTFPKLKRLFADGAYQGPIFGQGVAALRDNLSVVIVKRPAGTKAFTVLPKRWIVERSLAWLGLAWLGLAWLNRCRRLAKDWENLNLEALAFLRLASIRCILRKLCNP